jgi:tape measure domain-containing protein
VVGDALAASPVAAHYAVGIDCAVARVYAFLIPTCQHLRTLVVHGALGVVALDVGVASPALRAEAAGTVVPRLAPGSLAALGEAAGVHAGPVDALVGQGALQVAVAAG